VPNTFAFTDQLLETLVFLKCKCHS